MLCTRSVSRLVVGGTRDLRCFVEWSKHIRLQRNGQVSSEVSERMTIVPAVVPLLLVLNCDHFDLDPVEALVSLVDDIRCGFDSV